MNMLNNLVFCHALREMTGDLDRLSDLHVLHASNPSQCFLVQEQCEQLVAV